MLLFLVQLALFDDFGSTFKLGLRTYGQLFDSFVYIMCSSISGATRGLQRWMPHASVRGGKWAGDHLGDVVRVEPCREGGWRGRQGVWGWPEQVPSCGGTLPCAKTPGGCRGRWSGQRSARIALAPLGGTHVVAVVCQTRSERAPWRAKGSKPGGGQVVGSKPTK